MKPTKLAFDPINIIGSDPIHNEMKEIRRHMTNMLTSQLRIADLVRSCKLIGNHSLAVEAAKGNEIKVQFYLQMIDRFESLISQGFGFSASLWQMCGENWLNKFNDFESPE